MDDIKNCVYKYVSGEKIIYIGKTNNSLKNRIYCHSKEVKFNKYLNNFEIWYMQLSSPLETDLAEMVLINKYKPVLNNIGIYNEIDSDFVKIEENKWIKFHTLPEQCEDTYYEIAMNILNEKNPQTRHRLFHSQRASYSKRGISKDSYYDGLNDALNNILFNGKCDFAYFRSLKNNVEPCICVAGTEFFYKNNKLNLIQEISNELSCISSIYKKTLKSIEENLVN